jgi:hypothetical protein
VSAQDITIEAQGGGLIAAVYVRHRYRVLLSDGAALDVEAIRDDSTLRAALLRHAGKGKDVSISGVAQVDDT